MKNEKSKEILGLKKLSEFTAEERKQISEECLAKCLYQAQVHRQERRKMGFRTLPQTQLLHHF